MFNYKKIGILASLTFTLAVAGCGQESNQSNKSNSDQMNYTITGIEPGAGQTVLNEQVIAEYENLNGWTQDASSAGAMYTALDQAIQDEKPIMITAWSPHYKFAKWDLKFLEDPKGIFGDEEHGATLVRTGLADEKPTAYTILDRIYFEIPEIEAGLLRSVEEGLEFNVIAQQWVEENLETVEQWTEGVKPVDGTPLEIVTSPWDDSLFISNVAKFVLEEQGFEVELTPVDPAILFKSISTGDADATLSPWLPTSHGPLYEEYEGQFEDLGPVFKGAKIGLAVPTYMVEDSLEDFEPAE